VQSIARRIEFTMNEVEQRKIDLQCMSDCLSGMQGRRVSGFDGSRWAILYPRSGAIVGAAVSEIWEVLALAALGERTSLGSTLYTTIETWSPTDARMILVAGIRRLVVPESSLTPEFHEVGKKLRAVGIKVTVLSGSLEGDDVQSIAPEADELAMAAADLSECWRFSSSTSEPPMIMKAEGVVVTLANASTADECRSMVELLTSEEERALILAGSQAQTQGELKTIAGDHNLQGVSAGLLDELTSGEHSTLVHHGQLNHTDIQGTGSTDSIVIEDEVVIATAKGDLDKPVVSRSLDEFSKAMAEIGSPSVEEDEPLPSFPWNCIG